LISIYYSANPAGEKKKILSKFNSYTHEIVLVGWYYNASFSFNTNIPVAEDWMFNGIGRHVEVYSVHGNKVWEGVVNELSFSVGSRSIKVGPLLSMSNRIKIGFQTPSYGNIPGAGGGVYLETAWGDNAYSQKNYGVLEELISGGTGEDPEMEVLRDARLEKQGEPSILESISADSKEESITITVSCIGYSRILEKQVYRLNWVSGMEALIDLSEKINAILDANLYFTNRRKIVRYINNIGFDVPPEDEEDRTAWGIIIDHISKSPTPDTIKCGFESDMLFYLERLDDSDRYRRKSGTGIVLNIDGGSIPNSEVTPGGRMLMTDFSMPMSYKITSVQYSISNDIITINFQEGSLRNVMSSMMLGGFS